MRTSTSFVTAPDFVLQHAILLYGIEGQGAHFAALHDPIPQPDGAPLLGPAHPVTPDFVRALAEGLGREVTPEVLPPNVIARTADMIAWWEPSARRSLFWKKKAAHLNATEAPHPAYLFMVTGQGGGARLAIRALAASERPTANTPCFRAPLYNVNAFNGALCVGTMTRPDFTTLETITAWSDAVWGSYFTHPYGDGGHVTAHPGGVAGLWEALREAPGPFPAGMLVPADQTVGDFIAGREPKRHQGAVPAAANAA